MVNFRKKSKKSFKGGNFWNFWKRKKKSNPLFEGEPIFVASPTWQESHNGYVYTKGKLGQGYYLNNNPELIKGDTLKYRGQDMLTYWDKYKRGGKRNKRKSNKRKSRRNKRPSKKRNYRRN